MRRKPSNPRRAMTLIELVLVMGLLATILAISAPQLARFFSGRTLAEEVRRFIALTRHGREQAISESIVMELWIDPEEGSYGLRPQFNDPSQVHRPIEFSLPDGFAFAIDRDDLDRQGLAIILYWPDGAIDTDSIARIGIAEDGGETVWIEADEYWLSFRTVEGDGDGGY